MLLVKARSRQNIVARQIFGYSSNSCQMALEDGDQGCSTAIFESLVCAYIKDSLVQQMVLGCESVGGLRRPMHLL